VYERMRIATTLSSCMSACGLHQLPYEGSSLIAVQSGMLHKPGLLRGPMSLLVTTALPITRHSLCLADAQRHNNNFERQITMSVCLPKSAALYEVSCD
jgi:hypothetical protein